MSFSYDPTTNVGQVRLLISDTQKQDPVFTDEEISAFLVMESSNPHMAAARAYSTIVRNRALLAQIIKRDGYTTQEQALADLNESVKLMRQEAISQGGLQQTELPTDDSHLETFRPEWRDMGDYVVE